MGGMNPLGLISGGLGTVGQVVSTVAPIVSTGQQIFSDVQNFAHDPRRDAQRDLEAEQQLALKQLQERQVLGEQQSAQQRSLDQQQITLQNAADDEARQRALRRAVAKQRSRFAAQGISPVSGSGEAVLLGLFDETEDDLKNRDQLDALRSRALDLNGAQGSALNILQRTQLQERQALERRLSDF